MSPAETLIALFLLACGCALCVFFLKLLASSLFKLPGEMAEMAAVKRAYLRLSSADTLLEDNNFTKALQELESAFILNAKSSISSITAAREVNQNILSRCLLIADSSGSRIEELPIVEELLLERAECYASILKEKEKFSQLQSKRESSGKAMPSWGKREYQRKLQELNHFLKVNEGKLSKALAKLFQALRTPNHTEVTYH
ncbi:hypothetical protein JNK13_06705 [bacterium]|nr:hypothetical protein [bacterium]